MNKKFTKKKKKKGRFSKNERRFSWENLGVPQLHLRRLKVRYIPDGVFLVKHMSTQKMLPGDAPAVAVIYVQRHPDPKA